MLSKNSVIGSTTVLAILIGTLLVTGTRAIAQTETVLYSFPQGENGLGPDGNGPYAGLIFDSSGNLYSTTSAGGAADGGTVFELVSQAGGGWTEKVLHSFIRRTNVDLYDGLVFDGSGNLYGTAWDGGKDIGAVFELIHKAGGGWSEEILHNFSSDGDGYNPTAGVVFDGSGNLYGTTVSGGSYNSGVVFELMPKAGGGWSEKVLHNFGSNTNDNGANPYASLIFDGSGNLYGTTEAGGAFDRGTVFELTRKTGGGWEQKVLHSFGSGVDGALPRAGLIFDADGHLYGTTVTGGAFDFGTVFELAPKAGGGWTEKVLHNFDKNGTDGYSPFASLILDGSGNLYGTTWSGGAFAEDGNGGIVFELTPMANGRWTETILHSFDGNVTDGNQPLGGLIFDGAGNLYGTTNAGGADGLGTVFEITP